MTINSSIYMMGVIVTGWRVFEASMDIGSSYYWSHEAYYREGWLNTRLPTYIKRDKNEN